MPRAEGPEEFFKVLREVQQGKKRPDGGEPAAPVAAPMAPAPTAYEPEGIAPPGTVNLSYAAAAGGAVIVLLLVILAYLVGRQQGWGAYEAMLRRRSEEAAEKAAAPPKSPPPQAQDAEVIDGKVFTLLTLGKDTKDRESATKEAEYLNKYAPFKALRLEAYAWRDQSGRHRLCAKGFASMDEAARKHVRDQVRNLVSRQGRREYRDSDFLPQ